jgi:transcriptional regulator with XRE-family HTH domain
MASVDFTAIPTDMVATTPGSRDGATAERESGVQFHRIRTVRLQQGVSLRSASRQTGTEVRKLRSQEDEGADLKLSDLHKWSRALDVPVSELLVEPDTPLSRPVMERARMVRLMKTAAAIRERCNSEQIRRMADTLVEQLTEIMPELAEVGPWHNFGQRRSLNEYGRVAECPISDDFVNHGAFE